MTMDTTIDFDQPTTSLILAEEPFLQRLARRLARRHADAEDLVQETMLRAYGARDRFVVGTSMRAWLATILRRLYLTGALKDKRRATQTDTDADEPLARIGRIAEYYGDSGDTEYARVLQNVDEQMKHAFDRLPDTYRIPFLFFALDGLSYAEIAARLRIPVGTVMSRIHRARMRLQASVGPAKASRSKVA